MCWDTKNNPKSSAPYFSSNETLLFCQDHLKIELYLLYGYLGMREIWGNWAHIHPNHVQGHSRSNQKSSAPHFTSGKAISIKAFCGSNFICLTGTQILGQFGETGPEYPKSCAGLQEKNTTSSAPHFT